MAKDGKYTVFPEKENEAGSSLRQFTGMFEQLSDSKDFKRKKKKKSKKKNGKKSKDTKGKKAKGKKEKSKKSEKSKSKKRAKFDMWLRVIEKSIDNLRNTALDTSSYVTKRYADHKLPVNDRDLKAK